MIDLREHDAVVHGIKIVAMGELLADDLHRAGKCGPRALADTATEIMRSSVDLAEPGEPYGLWEAEMNLVDDRGVTTARVWAERFSATEATIYYPHER